MSHAIWDNNPSLTHIFDGHWSTFVSQKLWSVRGTIAKGPYFRVWTVIIYPSHIAAISWISWNTTVLTLLICPMSKTRINMGFQHGGGSGIPVGLTGSPTGCRPRQRVAGEDRGGGGSAVAWGPGVADGSQGSKVIFWCFRSGMREWSIMIIHEYVESKHCGKVNQYQ